MLDIEFTPVRMQTAIDTPLRVLALFVSVVLAAIIVLNAS